jgi:hypothetical protein
MRTPDVSQENSCIQKGTLLMGDVLQELKLKSNQIKRSQDTNRELIALETEKISKSIPRELFVSKIETIKLAQDTCTKDLKMGRKETNSPKPSSASYAPMSEIHDSSMNTKHEETKSNKSRILQDEFLCIAGSSLSEEPHIAGCFRVITIWRKGKKRIQRFFGFRK